jgi:predicted HNH restriction endonuclease
MHKHLALERNAKLRALAKDFWRNRLGRLRCLVCGFDFERRYGTWGAEFIEMHHIKSLASTRGRRRTKVMDLKPVCSNCHRMVHHKRRVPLTLHALRQGLRRTPRPIRARAKAARTG